MTDAAPSPAVVRDLVRAADDRRRRQQAGQILARMAPVGAAAVLLAGLVGRAAGWSVFVTLALLVLLALAALIWVFIATRARPATDGLAAQADADAGLSGELRSAFWFSSVPDRDEWAAFHVDRAAERASAVHWDDVYPPVRAGRAWLTAAALVAAAFALPAGLPSGSLASASAPAAAEVLAVEGLDFGSLPAELQKELLALLAAVQDGRMTTAEALVALRELTDVIRMDASFQQQIADLIQASADRRAASETSGAPKMADAGEMTGDVEWARENQASQQANEAAQRSAEGTDDGEPSESESQEPGPTTEQSAEGEAGEASAGETSAGKPIKSADAADGATGMMLASSSASVGEPGTVFGGKRGTVRYGTSETTEIAAALKRELIEATINVDRSNLDSEEDQRHKTQQSWSSLAYTRASGRTAFDRARTDARRAVPEARRPAVERYFVRTPAADDATVEPPPPAARD